MIVKPDKDYQSLFHPRYFLANFAAVFGSRFDQNSLEMVTNNVVRVEINVDAVMEASAIKSHEFEDFAQLTCLFFGLFGLRLKECVCYPTTLGELIMEDSNFSKKCIVSNNNKCALGNGVNVNCPQNFTQVQLETLAQVVNIHLTLEQS
jgi:hypothetical protein